MMRVGWIPVSERLPDFDTPVLITDGKTVVPAFRVMHQNYVLFWEGGYEYWPPEFQTGAVTHWMAFPEPPA